MGGGGGGWKGCDLSFSLATDVFFVLLFFLVVEIDVNLLLFCSEFSSPPPPPSSSHHPLSVLRLTMLFRLFLSLLHFDVLVCFVDKVCDVSHNGDSNICIRPCTQAGVISCACVCFPLCLYSFAGGRPYSITQDSLCEKK